MSHPQTVSYEKQIEQDVDGLRSGNSLVRSADQNKRQLILFPRKPDEGDPRLQKKTAGWEAHYFSLADSSRHVTGSSFESVRQKGGAAD